VILVYIGRTALTVTGPASGFQYRFAAPGARVLIDMRDAAALRRVDVLREINITPLRL
jgi:hypothetical protein